MTNELKGFLKKMEGHSIEGVMKAVSDSKSLDMFRSIAKASVESEILKNTNGLSKKQYYLRTRQLLKTGLIKRNKGRFSLTCLGVVVYHAQLVVEKGVNNFWKLKAIDSIQSSAEIGEHERTKLIKTIIDDSGIESILVSQR
jgi:predicted transcriptional regulator